MAARAFYTPRDRLQRLVDYAVRARRYWWLVAAFVVMGGALSVAFAMTRPKSYESSAILFYQERIQTSLIQGRDAATMQRNIGDRYRELLLARGQLSKIIEDTELNPFQDVVESEGMEAAVEELRASISFQVRGANTFKIAFKDADRHRAKAVTQRLTQLLIEKERDMRLEQAKATVDFAQDQLETANLALRGRENARFVFLSQHPEFAEEDSQGGEGAAIRKKDKEPTASAGGGGGSRRLSALTRQRDRIKARLAAGDNPTPAPPPPRSHTPSADEIAAQQKVDRAEDEVRSEGRSVEELRGKGMTDQHPDMKKAKDSLAAAVARLKKAEAELSAAAARSGKDDDVVLPPSSPMDRAALEKELKEFESEIATERARTSGNAKPTPTTVQVENKADEVIGLESDWARLGREVAEQEERVQTLNDAFFRAQLDAQTRTAEQGSALQVVDEAYLPLRPIGKGKKLLVLAGLVVFSGLGLALAVGLAIIDDRVYRRVDIEQLDLAPVLAVIPRGGKRPKPKRTG